MVSFAKSADNLDFSLSAFPTLITFFLAALSNIAKAVERLSFEGLTLAASTADLAFVLLALLIRVFLASALSFFFADLVIGMAQFYIHTRSFASEPIELK